MQQRLNVLCGGSGSSKFALALARGIEFSNDNYELKFFSNVGDNFWHHGLYVCPDVDIITHALSGSLDEQKGWGVVSDSYVVRDELAKLDPSSSWFNLGDRDLALSIRRTELLKQGKKLSEITEEFRVKKGVKYRIIPASDDHIQTEIQTENGWEHLQEFWVKNKATEKPLSVRYKGIETAKPNPELLNLEGTTLICPANPVTSISPIISLEGVKESLKKTKCIAISPFLGGEPFSGPAGILMKSLGKESSSSSLAFRYSSFLKILIVDEKESNDETKKVKNLGIECIPMKTKITDRKSQLDFWTQLKDIL